MESIKSLTALGIMSGSSLDGAEFALIKTDGVDVYDVIKSQKFLYSEDLQFEIIKSIKNNNEKNFASADEMFTDFIIQSYTEFMADNDYHIDIIGFEGHTIAFSPENHCIEQIGNAQKIADFARKKVVYHFHNNDLALGGNGAPMSATYYASIAAKFEKPLAFLNIGGTTMLFFFDELGTLKAFDCGVGNNIINMFMRKHACVDMDYDGKCAISGSPDEKVLKSMLKDKYIDKLPPKASSPDMFLDKMEYMEGLSVVDGAATATEFVARAIFLQMKKFLPELPKNVIICGGGKHNPTLKRFLRRQFSQENIRIMETSNFDADTTEAQALGFLAARRIYNMPISFPSTTGVLYPAIGGNIADFQK